MSKTVTIPLPNGRTAAVQFRVFDWHWVWWASPTTVAVDDEPPLPVVDVTRWAQVGLWLAAGSIIGFLWARHYQRHI